jgi:non-specific serine/threonine protein kinase
VRVAAIAAILALSACGPAAETSGPAPPSGSTSPWRKLSPVPTPRTEIGAVLMGGRIFVMGGFNAAGVTVPTVEAYNIATDRWSARRAMPLAVNHPMAAAGDDTIYLVGGHTQEGPPTDRAFAFANGGWEELPRMPEPRAAGGAAVVDGLLYVVAGIGLEGHATRTLVYDIEAERWSVAAGVGVPRDHLGVTATEGVVYAVGGRTEAFVGNLGASEAYDPGVDSWQGLPEMPTPRGGIAAAAAGGLVVALGGEQEGGTFDEAEAYDVASGAWRSLPPMPTSRHGLGVVSDGSTIYAVAGGTEPGLSVTGAVEAFDLT